MTIDHSNVMSGALPKAARGVRWFVCPRWRGGLGFVAALGLFLAAVAGVAQQPDYAVDWATVDGGGAVSTDGFFGMQSTVGQPDAGRMSDGFYTMEGGFWAAGRIRDPGVTIVPGDTRVSLGTDVTFEAAATGSGPFIYQWRLNGVNLEGKTNRVLTISGVSVAELGSYSVVVKNAFGVARSEPALLLAELTRFDPGDDFADRAVFAGNATFMANTEGYTVEPGEPLHAGKLGGASGWYSWTAPADGIATIETKGTAFDTILAVYEGKSLATLMPVAGDDDRGGFLTSRLRFNAQSGTAYHIALDGLGGRAGPTVFRLLQEVTSETLPIITEQPASRAVMPGENAIFNVEATGAGLGYQWKRNGVPLPGATSPTLVVFDVRLNTVGFYSVEITNADGRTVESDLAALEIGPVATALSFGKVEDLFLATGLIGGPGGPLNLSALAAGVASSASGTSGAIPVSVGSIVPGGFSNYDSQGAIPCETECGVIGGSARYLEVEPDQDGMMRISAGTTNENINLALYVFEYQLAYCDFFVACGLENGGAGMTNEVEFPVLGGQRYVVVVDGEFGEKTEIAMEYQLCLAQAPYLESAEGFYLFSEENPQPYDGQPDYVWLMGNSPIAMTAEPFLLLDMPPETAVPFGVYYTAVTEEGIVNVTNRLGIVMRVRQEIAPGPEDMPVFRLRLPGLAAEDYLMQGYDPAFRIERADPLRANCRGGWNWVALDPEEFSNTIDGDDVVVDLPLHPTSQYYRVRPVPEGLEEP